MKIKEVCTRTGLTERTIRFYQQKGLISPASHRQNDKTFYDYSEKDITVLEETAMLRRCGFSIEEIQQIRCSDSEALSKLCQAHLEKLRGEQREQQFQLRVMETLESVSFRNPQEFLNALSEAFEKQKSTASPPPVPSADITEPDFSRFDSETPEQKMDGYLDFLISQRKKDKREKRLRPFKRAAKIIFIAAAGVFAAFLLSCIPHPISRDMQAVVFTPDTQQMQTLNISVQGKLTSKLFYHPVFSGYLRIEHVAYTQENSVTIDFYGGMDVHGWVVYSEINQGTPFLHPFGLIYTDKDFKQIVMDMRFHEEPWNVLGDPSLPSGPVLCAPAGSYEEALAMAESRIKQPPLSETARYFE